MNLRELRAQIIKKLKNSQNDSPEADAGLILMHSLGINKTELLIGDISVPASEIERINSFVERCATGEPIQYIVGKCEFMSLSFDTLKGVLIPRSDTEILVESVIKRLDKDNHLLIADIGCGSGCIGISLAYYLNNLSVMGFDISDDALKLANSNAKQLGTYDRMEFIKLDITKDHLPKTVDCIVSNPPYIQSNIIYHLDNKVKFYEPLIALDGGEDGLDFYKIIAQRPQLKDGGLLAFEIGYDQGQQVSQILIDNGYKNIEIIKDIEGRDRVVLGYATGRTTAQES